MGRSVVAVIAVISMLAVGAFVSGAGFGQGPTIEHATAFKSFNVVAKVSSAKAKGKIESDDSDCVPGRKVKLLRKRNGKKKTLGSDKTDDKGKFKIKVSSAKNGKYYGQVSQKDLPATDSGQAQVCLKEKSGSVKVS